MKTVEKNSAFLEKIANNFSKNSGEYKALKISALAYGFAIMKYEHEFKTYLKRLETPLTQAEEEYIKEISS
jgi:hypothetical protein